MGVCVCAPDGGVLMEASIMSKDMFEAMMASSSSADGFFSLCYA